MGVLSRLDALAAKHLFHPPVIAICQKTGQSHHAVGHALNFLTAVFWTWHIHMYGWFWLAAIGMLVSLFLMWVALRYPEAPLTAPSKLWRFIAWLILTTNMYPILVHHDAGMIRSNIFWLLVLFYEYTKTIVTIPPKKRKEKKTSTSLKESKV